jgi:hypothetical protein
VLQYQQKSEENMRDLAKSMISWGWSMSVFTALQGVRLLTPNGSGFDDSPAGALNKVTDAATPLLTGPAKMAWQAGVAAQNAVFHVIAKPAPAPAAASLNAEPAAAGEPVPIGTLTTKLDA